MHFPKFHFSYFFVIFRTYHFKARFPIKTKLSVFATLRINVIELLVYSEQKFGILNRYSRIFRGIGNNYK